MSGLALKNQKLQTTELLSAEPEQRDDSLYWVYSHLSQVLPAAACRLPLHQLRGCRPAAVHLLGIMSESEPAICCRARLQAWSETGRPSGKRLV